ncbi:unnamed protein product, partial [Symbiodinium sp. CCMP2592]
MSGFSSLLRGEPDEMSISGPDPEQGPESASEFSGERRGIFDLLRDSSELEPENRFDFLDEEVNWYQSVADLSDEPEHLWAAEPSDLGDGPDNELPVPADRPCDVSLPTLEPLPMLSPVRFQGPGSADPQQNAWQVDAVLFDVKRRRLSVPAQPWKSGPFALKMPGVGSAASFLDRARPSVGLADVLNPPLNLPLGVREPEPVLAWVVESRLRHFRVERSDEDLRVHALARIRTLVMLDPLASKLGRSLASDVEHLATEEEISSSFSHAFASKAASTIHKRAGSLCKFASWCMREGASPLRFEEVHLYRYLCVLQKSAGATSGSHLIEALRFLDSVVSLVQIEVEEVMSARCRGVAQEMHMTKAPLKQKKALTRKQVEHLELFTTRASSRHACISGQLLWCMHSGSRWRDSQTLRHLELEALISKTTLTARAKTTLLPYVGVGLGVSGLPWAKAWVDARAAEGLTDVDPFLPTFCERRGCWGSQRMSASEASIYLREFFQSMDSSYGELRELGTHSMKRTLLSWAGKSHPVTFTHPERRLLGHHLDQENKSVVVYSKDAYVALCGKVLGMYATVPSGLFDPDMSAVMRMKSIAQRAADSEVSSLSSGSEEPTEDLQASFKERALKVGISSPVLQELLTAGFTTFGKLCFAVSANPTQLDDTAVDLWVRNVFSTAPSPYQVSCLRRLLFEANSLNIADLHTRVEPPADNVVRKLPAAERAARAQAQQARLAGVVFTPETIPANGPVDLFVDQLESEILQYVGPERCVSRAQEMMAVKKDKTINVDQDGRMRINSKPNDLRCETSSDARLRAAWNRRSLAMDLAGVCSYIEIEKWVQHLFSCQAREVPKGMSPISVNQLIQADRALFMYASEKLMGRLAAPAGQPKPLDDVIQELMHSPQVTQFLQPVPRPPDPPAGWDSNAWKGKGKKGKEGKDGKGKTGKGTGEDCTYAGKLDAVVRSPTLSVRIPIDRTFDDAEALAVEQLERCSCHYVITDFEQGGLVVEDPDGPERACFQGKVIHGRVIPFQNHVLVFDAQSQRHWTQAWKGCRQVLVAYSVPTQGLSAADVKFLRDLGFELPSAATVPRPIRDGRPWAIEVFAGSAVLSKAWVRAGFRVLAIDICVRGAQVPIAPLDLTSPSGLKIFWDLVAKLQPEAIHVGVPCGTASRAREKRLPANIVAAGAPEPQPLRDALHPLGLPSLSPGSLDELRVAKANQLYELSLDIALFCIRHNIVVSIENPARSWAWAVLVELLRQRNCSSDCASFNRLQSVVFHSCMHGGSRPKQTKLLCTAGVFDTLNAQCDGQHQHEPWSVRAKGGRWHFATAQEAAYPPLLAARMARCLLLHVQLKLPAVRWEPALSVVSSAAVSRQTRKHAALIPEFAQVLQLPASQVDKGMRVLREVSFHGECAGDCESREHAQALKHPFDTHNPVAAVTVEAIDFLVRSSPQQVTLHRKLALLELQLLIKKGEREEADLHSKMHPSVAKVMRGKKILALKALLEQEGYDDLEAIKFLTEGVHVMGSEPPPPGFDKKVKAATLTERDLRDTAKERREAIVGDDAPGDAAKAQLLFKVTQEEVDLGFLDGPYTADEISNLVGRDQWCVIRRFLLDQGSKHRPIDDACQSQTNAAYSATIRLELHNADYVASLALLIAKKAKDQKHGSGAWLGKCLDLTKAYKQVALHPDQRDLCITYFRGPGGEEKNFLPNALMFGATAAVFGFIRISRCLWFLANKYLKVPSACYFDDYPLFAPEEGAQEADECISQFFTMLGWSHAVTGEKGPVAFQRLQKLSTRVKHVLESMPPRVLSCNFACESILVWTDGSWEAGHAGIGACIWDPLKQRGHVLGGVAPAWAIESWKEDFDARDGEPQLICHIELLVLVAVRWMFQDQFLNRRVIMFVDNDAARYAILKGGSGSDGMNNLVQLFDLPDLKFPSLYWIDRVPSISNIAHGPSRDDFALALKLMKATCVEAFAWHDELKTSVITRRK